MRGGSSREVVRHLRTLYQFGVAGTFSDEQLLERFLARRDETAEEAFAELVQRHGPMVLGVCRRILGDAHEAEDAFQATFLVLARKAASVVRREKVASWLYGVAVRTAKEARGRAARRRAREERVSTPIHVEPPDDGFPDELRDDPGRGARPAAGAAPGGGGPLRARGPVAPRGGPAAGHPRGHALQPAGAGQGPAPRPPGPPRRLPARRRPLGHPAPRGPGRHPAPLALLESTVEAATLVAAGPSAAAAISASVASLSEGVHQDHARRKTQRDRPGGRDHDRRRLRRRRAGAVGTGADGPGPVADHPQRISRRNCRSPHGSDQDDRAAALEKKLDRILDALERSRRRPASASRGAAERSHAQAAVRGPVADGKAAIVQLDADARPRRPSVDVDRPVTAETGAGHDRPGRDRAAPGQPRGRPSSRPIPPPVPHRRPPRPDRGRPDARRDAPPSPPRPAPQPTPSLRRSLLPRLPRRAGRPIDAAAPGSPPRRTVVDSADRPHPESRAADATSATAAAAARTSRTRSTHG